MTESNVMLRPGITNPRLWSPERPPKSQWDKIRKIVLKRDDYTCSCCGHKAKKYMNIHHLEESDSNEPENLTTLCVACHAVLHMGRNLDLKIIEIWESEISQVEIIRHTREGIKNGKTLEDINSEFALNEGSYAPDSIEYANSLIPFIGDSPRAYLSEPLCAIFVGLKRWQIE